jgi:hypothetical protein
MAARNRKGKGLARGTNERHPSLAVRPLRAQTGWRGSLFHLEGLLPPRLADRGVHHLNYF